MLSSLTTVDWKRIPRRKSSKATNLSGAMLVNVYQTNQQVASVLVVHVSIISCADLMPIEISSSCSLMNKPTRSARRSVLKMAVCGVFCCVGFMSWMPMQFHFTLGNDAMIVA